MYYQPRPFDLKVKKVDHEGNQCVTLSSGTANLTITIESLPKIIEALQEFLPR